MALAAGLFGAALLYGDGLITPAISVLGAIEGLEVAAPSVAHLVKPLAVGVLLALFAFQSRGTERVGGAFGPIMVLWFAVLAVVGCTAITRQPEVLWALSPHHGLLFLAREGWAGLSVLGVMTTWRRGRELLRALMTPDPSRWTSRPRCAWSPSARAARPLRTFLLTAAVTCAVLTSVSMARAGVTTRAEGRLGSVSIYEDAAAHSGLVFLFSDASGWRPGLASEAGHIVAGGAVVVGVDLPTYLESLRTSHDGCHYVVAELEDLSQRLQREYGFTSYRSPILAGIGAGGALAYAALAQSPAATVAGAISVDPTPALETRVPLCAGAPATADPAGGYRYGAAAQLPGLWWVSPRGSLPAALAKLAEEAAGAPRTGSAERRLTALVLAALAQQAAADKGLRDLPLVELPVAGASTQMAVIYSGDGGWRDLDKQIAEVLAREGTPVVGVDCLRYFWNEKAPEVVAADLTRILRHYRARWGARRVLLIGYSFGAGVLPFAFHGLAPDLQEAIAQISLLGLAPRAPFRISVSGWLGVHGRGLPVLPELQSLDLRLIQCVYGEEEDDTLCTAPELAEVERIRTSGGHHFDGDYEKLARDILKGAAQRLAQPAGSG